MDNINAANATRAKDAGIHKIQRRLLGDYRQRAQLSTFCPKSAIPKNTRRIYGIRTHKKKQSQKQF